MSTPLKRIWAGDRSLRSRPAVDQRPDGGLVFSYDAWQHTYAGRCSFTLWCEVGAVYQPEFAGFFREHQLAKDPLKILESPYVMDQLDDPTPAKPAPSLTSDFYFGTKKVYALDMADHGESDRIKVLFDCDQCNGCGCLEVLMTREQYLAWRSRSRPIAEIFPDLPTDVRETLISGTTPLEWRSIFGRRPGEKLYTIGDLRKLGYTFDEPDLDDKEIAPGQEG